MTSLQVVIRRNHHHKNTTNLNEDNSIYKKRTTSRHTPRLPPPFLCILIVSRNVSTMNRFSLLLVVALACIGAALAASGHGWNDNIDWKSFDEAEAVSKSEGKPIMYIIHKSWCGACKALKPKFAESKDIEKLASEFVMVRCCSLLSSFCLSAICRRSFVYCCLHPHLFLFPFCDHQLSIHRFIVSVFESFSHSPICVTSQVNLLDDDEPKDEAFKPDGGYIPRIIFRDSTGNFLNDITGGNAKYKYFYPNPNAITASMKIALQRNGASVAHTSGKEEL